MGITGAVRKIQASNRFPFGSTQVTFINAMIVHLHMLLFELHVPFNHYFIESISCPTRSVIMVSRGAKVVLGGALCFASAIIILVHQMQQADRLRLREGVLRDMERQERKRKNMEELKQQIELTRKLQEQRESDVASN